MSSSSDSERPLRKKPAPGAPLSPEGARGPLGRLFMLPVPISEGTISSVLPQESLQCARELRYFLAENAKSARAFLKECAHPLPMADISIKEIGHRPDASLLKEWLAPALAGCDIGVVSEAGCPGVADPGALIAKEAHRLGIRVVPLVGPSSILLALMASGMDGQHFRFCGYLPIKEPARSRALCDLEKRSASGDGETQLFIETPYRNSALLADLIRSCAPATEIMVATDITGKEESIRTKSAAEWRKSPPELPKLPTVFGILSRRNR